MTRMHINLSVDDLDRSVVFYTRLFGAEPTVRKSDYAKWMLDDPRVNFAIGHNGGAAGIEHLGIEAESRDELDRLRRRLSHAADGVEHEGETVCCYARSDKSWITDAQSVRWELFYTHGTSDTYRSEREDSCCG